VPSAVQAGGVSTPRRGAFRFPVWLAFLAPTVGVLLAITIFPLVYSLALSLHSWTMGSLQGWRFVGLSNFQMILRDDPYFWTSVRVTLTYVSAAVGLELVLGLGIALLLNRRADGRGGVVQTLLILPTMMTPVVVGIVWRLLYNPDLGFLNYVMSLMGIPPQNWLGDLRTALPAVLAQALGWSVASWAVSALLVYTVLRAFDVDVPFSAAVFVMCATALGMVVPSSPGYIGVFHAIAIQSLVNVFDVDRSRAASFALLQHALLYLTPIAFGGVFLWLIAALSTFSTMHLLAHAAWAQAAMIAGGVQLALVRGKLSHHGWALVTAGGLLLTGASFLIHEQNDWLFSRSAFLHHAIGWVLVAGALFPIGEALRPRRTVWTAGFAVTFLIVAVLLYADRDIAPIFGRLGDVGGAAAP